jgi:hypothetical protein
MFQSFLRFHREALQAVRRFGWEYVSILLEIPRVPRGVCLPDEAKIVVSRYYVSFIDDGVSILLEIPQKIKIVGDSILFGNQFQSFLRFHSGASEYRFTALGATGVEFQSFLRFHPRDRGIRK